MKLQNIGNKIKQLRKQNSITQENLANLAGISRVTLGKLERGQMGAVSVTTLDIILNALGYEMEIIEKKSNDYGIPTLDELA